LGEPHILNGGKPQVAKRSDLGAPNLRTSTSHKVYTYRNQKFWAQGGRIYVVDEATGDFKSCSRKEFLLRLRGMSDGRDRLPWGDEKAEMQRAIEDGIMAVAEAQRQGDPHDSVVQQEKARQRRSVLRSGGIGAAYPSVFPNGAVPASVAGGDSREKRRRPSR